MKLKDDWNPTTGILRWLSCPWRRWGLLGVLLFSFTPQILADINEQEPNDSRKNADTVLLDGNYQGRVGVAQIRPRSDVDYFKVTTPAFSGVLTLTAIMTPTSGDGALDAKVELEDASGSLTSRGGVLAVKNNGFDNIPETMAVAVNGGTTYYLRCTSADLFSSGSGNYTLSVRVSVPQTIISAYWLAPNFVTEGTVATMRAQVSGFSVGDQFSFEIREDDGLLGSDQVTTQVGKVYSSDGKLYVDATWTTGWIPDQSGDPEFFFIVSRGGVARQSGEADELHVAIGDRDDQIGEAVASGAMTQTRSNTGEIGSPTDADLFSFTVAAGQRISFDVDRPSGTLAAYLRVFDASGNELAHNTGGTGPGELPGTEAYLERTFPTAGTFYVGVSGVGNQSYNALTGVGDAAGSTGAYTLVLSPGIAGTTDYQVDILRYGTNPLPIDPSLRTWIVIHGWMSSRTSGYISATASNLAAIRPGDQILTLDWRAADTWNPFAAESSIIPVGQWAATALTSYGFNGTNLNLVGHSFGSYVADELAERMGGVNTIVALDAAENIAGGYDPEDPSQVNFARNSMFSWAFHSSTFGSGESPVTADETFVVKGGQYSRSAHNDAVFLFAYLLAHPTDLVGQYFLLTRLLAGILGPWIPDQFFTQFLGETRTGGYEGEIVTDGTGIGLVPRDIDFKPTGPAVSVTGNGVQITDGDTTPSSSEGTDFGSSQPGQAGPTRTFTLKNDGGSTLTLGTLSLPAGFSLVGQFPANVARGDSASFTVRLNTASSGAFSGQISFTSNDSKASPFNFAVTGTVLPTLTRPPELKLIAGAQLTLHVDGAAGTHIVEFTESLAGDPVWRAVKTLTAGESWVPPIENEQGYFRAHVP